jgi:SdpC family antimicrobial peptide
MRVRMIVSAALCAAMLFVGLPPGSAYAAENGQLTSRQLFEGIFFGKGPAAKMLSGMWTADAYKMTSVLKVSPQAITVLESRISQHDGKFFSDFGNAMTSDDPARVAAAIERTRLDVNAVAKEDVNTAKSLKPDDTAVADDDVATNVNLALAVIAVVVAIAAVVVLAVVAPEQDTAHARNEFVQSKGVAEITSAFAHVTIKT